MVLEAVLAVEQYITPVPQDANWVAEDEYVLARPVNVHVLGTYNVEVSAPIPIPP